MIPNPHHQQQFVVFRSILKPMIPFMAIIVFSHFSVNECLYHAAAAIDAQRVQKKKKAPPANIKKDKSFSVSKSIKTALFLAGVKIEQNDKGEITGLSTSATDFSYAVLKLLPELSKLEKIEIPNASRIDLSQLANIATIQKLKELSLQNAMRMTEKGLEEIAKLKNLQKFTLTGYRKGGISIIAKLTKLTSLDLSNTGIDEKSLKMLHSLKNLKELKISNCRLLNKMNPQTLAKFTSLERLSVSNNFWFTDRHLAELVKLKKLKYLDLWFVNIGNESLKTLQSFSALRSLKISGSKLTDEGIAHLVALKNLEELNFYRTKITDKAMNSIGRMVKLKFLEIRRCSEITDEGLKNLEKLKALEKIDFTLTPIEDGTLKRISKLPKVEVLKLGFCKNITVEGWKHLGKMKKLKVLSLEATKIDNPGLMQLANLTDLKELNLNNCSNVSDSGLEALKNMKKLERLELRSTKVKLIPHIDRLRNLKSLILYNTRLADAGLKKLAKMKQLRHLDLRQTKVTTNGLATIRKNLTSVSIQAKPAPPIVARVRPSRNGRSTRNYGTQFVIVNINRIMNNEEKATLFEKLKKIADDTRFTTNYVADTSTGTVFYISRVSDPSSFKSKLKANIPSVTIKKSGDKDALERKIEIEWKN